MRLVSRTSIAFLFAALAGAANAEAQDHDHATPDAPVVIEVDMSDYTFAPTPLLIPAGRPVTLVFTNTGDVAHEFMAGRSPASGDFEVDLFEGVQVETGAPAMGDHDAMLHDHPADAGAHDHAPAAPAAADHGHADAGGHDHADAPHGTMVEVDTGARATMTFTLPADRRGEWEMACFLPRHYERRMHGQLIVY